MKSFTLWCEYENIDPVNLTFQDIILLPLFALTTKQVPTLRSCHLLYFRSFASALLTTWSTSSCSLYPQILHLPIYLNLEVALVFLLPTHGLAGAAHFPCGTYHVKPFVYIQFPDCLAFRKSWRQLLSGSDENLHMVNFLTFLFVIWAVSFWKTMFSSLLNTKF